MNVPDSLSNLKILLLQARRPGDPAKAEELSSFAARCGVEERQIVSHDLLEGPPTLDELRRHDALMVGGSGEFYVSDRSFPHYPQLLDFLRRVVELGHPTFASCFGFQCLVEALGGGIVHDPDNIEIGTHTLKLTEAGRRDSLFGKMPDTFLAQLGRKDRAAGDLNGYPILATSARAPVQALRIPGKPIWASQFHPELDRDANLERFDRYLEGYARVLDPAQQEETRRQFRDSPATLDLLQRFLRLVFV